MGAYNSLNHFGVKFICYENQKDCDRLSQRLGLGPVVHSKHRQNFLLAKKRDTVTYELKKGNKVVYVGTTNDPERREQQHRHDGKKFSHMKVTSRRMTKGGAKKKEAERLTTYRKYQGKFPRYNKDTDG